MRFLSKDQLHRLLEVARAENPQDHLLILVTYLHALRCSEAINLHIGPTSKRIPCMKDGKSATVPCGYIEDNEIIVSRLKGSMRTRQPLVSSGDPLLDEKTLLSACKSGPLFGGYTRHTFSNRVRKYSRLAGIPKSLSFCHALKHSCLYHAVKGATINELQAYAGHRSGASTLRYLVCDEETAAKSVMNAIMEAA